MCGAVPMFACLDAIGEVSRHPHGHAAGGRRALRLGVPAGAADLQSDHPPGPVADRAAVRCSSAARCCCSARPCFNFMAFRYLQLDEALAILFSTPFLVAILAGPMLGEWVGWRRWIAIGVGLRRRAGGGAAGARRHAMGGAALGRQRDLLRLLQHHHPHAGAPRFQRDHAVLCQPVRRGDHAAGPAVRLDAAAARCSTSC